MLLGWQVDTALEDKRVGIERNGTERNGTELNRIYRTGPDTKEETKRNIQKSGPVVVSGFLSLSL